LQAAPPRPICPNCGSGNPPTLSVCWKCGATLAITTPPQQPGLPTSSIPASILSTPATVQPQASPPTVPPQYTYAHTSTDTLREWADVKRRKDTGSTKNGLVILAIGFAVSTIGVVASYFTTLLGPVALILGFVSGIAGLASLVGGLLVVLGRQSFGPKHSRNAIISVVLFITSIILSVIGGLIFTFSVVLAVFNAASNASSVTSASITNAFNIFLVTIIVGAVLSGMASVFLTYALQQSTGRIILWAAYISSLALTIMNSIVTFQGIAEAINEAFANGRYNPAPLQGLQSQQNPLQLLTIIPTLVFALAFYMVWDRIVKGELPESTTVPTTPAY